MGKSAAIRIVVTRENGKHRVLGFANRENSIWIFPDFSKGAGTARLVRVLLSQNP